jgi:SAM-dependent methyltransferase
MSNDDLPELPATAFLKEDGGDDLDFYATARLVTHIDESAIAALTGFYRQVLPASGVILDLMSSWVSHLPADVAYAEVIGHGMNADELAANPRLDRWFIQDLNRNAALPLVDAGLDGAMICVAVQYLQQPAVVFAELARALKPGAPLVVSFSNRCFPTKAVRVWLALDNAGQTRLVDLYMRKAGFSEVAVEPLVQGWASDPLIAVVGRV